MTDTCKTDGCDRPVVEDPYCADCWELIEIAEQSQLGSLLYAHFGGGDG